MRAQRGFVSIAIGSGVVGAGVVLLTPGLFAGRIMPGVVLAGRALAGLPVSAVDDVVVAYERQLLQQPARLRMRDKEISRSLGEIGVSLDRAGTAQVIVSASARAHGIRPVSVPPVFAVDHQAVAALAEQEFSQYLTFPQNATLTVSPGIRSIMMVPSAPGESIDLTSLAADVMWRAAIDDWADPIELAVVSAPASVHDGEVAVAQQYAQRLLAGGLLISDGATAWTIGPVTIERLLRFIPVADPDKPDNQILGVTFDGVELNHYLTTTIAPDVDQPAIDARFERVEDRVTQFTASQAGTALNIAASAVAIQQGVAAHQPTAPVTVDVMEPTIKEIVDVATLGITELLATGTSTYTGSPANRIHNILEGTKRYHGLLIKPGQEFSFNEWLGPVDGNHGFKPELVIKKNVTVPEFGGGLCQVSTTMFRAAIQAGLKITARRNHAYAVSYYGTPGFDATIYPPYTDLRFTNNTPGYILIQAKSEGTTLAFELWGTYDGREVAIDGPHPYGRTPDGAVKATLTQKVTRDDELVIDDAFYSRYQSPKLFPKPNVTNPPTPLRQDSAGQPLPAALP